MGSVKRENAAHSTDELVRVAKKIEHREDHYEEIENKLRDIAQDGAEGFGRKAGFFLNALLYHCHHVGIGIKHRNVMGEPRPAFCQHWRVLFRNRVLHATRNRKGLTNEQRGYQNGGGQDQKKTHPRTEKVSPARW